MNLGKLRQSGRFVTVLLGLSAWTFASQALAEESRLPMEGQSVTASDEVQAAPASQEPTPAKRPRPALVQSLLNKRQEGGSQGDAPSQTPRAAVDDGIGPIGAAASPSAEPAADKPSAAPMPATPAVAPEQASADQPLQPIADPLEAPPAEIEAASLKGVVPGVATMEDVEAAWGVPKEIRKVDGAMIHLYSVEPFDRIELTFFDDKCTAIVVRLQKAFPAEAVAKQLELDAIRPVFVTNELGEVLGQAYPERGVLFTFVPSEEPGKASMSVSEIVLEPITAEPFVLRGELTMDVSSKASLLDMDAAVKIDAKNSRAHWLRARLLNAMGEQEKAMAAIANAVAIDPENPQYRVTCAQILAQSNRLAEAAEAAEKAVELGEKRPHIKARALCILGDLAASGSKPDFAAAIAYHEDAVKVAGAMADQKYPAVRTAAKEVMVDAYLGAAHDIAWGSYSEKEKAVKVWLDLAASAAEDLIANEGANEEVRFRAATRSIAACVGMRGAIDPSPWVKVASQSGRELIDHSRDATRRSRFEWELGAALYDAMQVSQLRRDNEAAAKIGREAVEHIEAAAEQRPTAATAYLLGRLYFRLGAMEAVHGKHHASAVEWFDKALVQFAKPMPAEVAADGTRQGESLVIMGVSYWEVGQRERSVDLTTRGVTLLENSVKKGTLAESSLVIPYVNLSAMHQQLGKTEAASRYQKMAAKAKATQIR